MLFIENNSSIIILDGKEKHCMVCDECGKTVEITSAIFYKFFNLNFSNKKHYCNECDKFKQFSFINKQPKLLGKFD